MNGTSISIRTDEGRRMSRATMRNVLIFAEIQLSPAYQPVFPGTSYF
jgi:hypothetical protein